MRVGIIFSLYGCERYMDRCLSPWIKLRKELNLVLTATNGMYNDFLNYGFEDRSHKSLIKAVGKDFDFLISTTGEYLWDEQNSRNYALNYLKDRNVDVVWVVDGDEFYTEDDIKNIINFISDNSEPDAYAVQFKNYTIKIPYWTEGFCRETIYWTNRNGGILDFHFDVFVRYNNGKTINETRNFLRIPKSISYIDHYSWLSDDPRIPEKIIYQNGRFSGKEGERCSFMYEDLGVLDFNPRFWEGRDLEVPILHETLGPHCTDFDLNFSRKNRNIDIFNVSESRKYEFLIYSPEGDLIYSSDLYLSKGLDYFIYPGPYNFNYFRVCVLLEGNKIHDENLHLKI